MAADVSGQHSVNAPDRAAAPRRIVERETGDAGDRLGVDSPLLRRIYAGRGIRRADELDYRLERLAHFRDLKDIDRACDRLAEAMASRSRIIVVGDFDTDGATSTALVCDALEAMGATRVDFFIPHRIEHGYGLSRAVVAAIGPGAAGDLIVTVDNGIASIDGVAAAREVGWQVLVCDHHLPGETLPDAQAIINPNQPGCGFVGKSLAGVGVAFYLIAALRARLATLGSGASLPRLSDYLDLVAVGTVADIVPLDHLNRTLVHQGLERIRRGRARPGLRALIDSAGRDPGRLSTDDIGFAIGPRLNAAGRLENMRIGVACLRSGQLPEARALADQLSQINRARRSVQSRMQAEADAAVEALAGEGAARDAIVVHHDDWHEGIVGLVASRLRERHQRPVVAFAPAANGRLKGSARSIPGLHIRDVLAAIDAREPGLIAQFGGHAQAAGLSLDAIALDAFRQAFARNVGARLTPAMCSPDIVTDGELDDNELALETARCLESGGPWGAGFEAPCFHGRFEILNQRIVGERHLKLEVRRVGGTAHIEAMRFQCETLLDTARPYRLVYRLAVNVFNGVTRPNLIVSEHRPA